MKRYSYLGDPVAYITQALNQRIRKHAAAYAKTGAEEDQTRLSEAKRIRASIRHLKILTRAVKVNRPYAPPHLRRRAKDIRRD